MPARAVFIVLALLSMLHVYIGMRLVPAIDPGPLGVALAVALLAASTLLMPAGLLSVRFKRWRWADQLAWAGMLTMGFFSSLLVLTLVRDLGLLVFEMAGGAGQAIVRGTAMAVPLLALGVTLIGLVNARRVARVVEVEVPIAGLPTALHGYSIVQISDVHVGPTIKRGYLNAIVTKVNALKPDAIAITGDLVDGSVRRLRMHTEPLARLSARDGAFFVTGNHEYYSGADEWIAEMRRLGLTVLMNQHVVCERGDAALMIAGVTDFTAHHFDESHRSNPRAAAAGAPDHVTVRILLAHQPRSAPAAADAGFHLQLSGHTHGGQFFPWNLFVPLQQPFTAGLNRMSELWVYTSRGTGYWGPPKRFGAPSEITRVRLVAA
ncbi:metallophosphoesterase [Massilia pseudoviolaceinigra]|uniref:metallophosphoesterase n=1 Tax=Massilia pseudoviolaceinigra TaxID=3057165 RepID=UPI00279658EB|nr:metallophosphoesterase [Massilia sp. CCM 9206]MDQ1922435.1 metallophosphoesterase [Massilia sp. CCM 9206]